MTEPATSEASATTSSETSESPPYEEPLDPDAEALATLQSNRENTLAWLHLDDRWVLQLSSKMDGSVDEMQYAEDGGHVFHYPDILAEHERTKELLDGFGIGSLTLLGSDFGRTRGGSGFCSPIQGASRRPPRRRAAARTFIPDSRAISWRITVFPADCPHPPRHRA